MNKTAQPSLDSDRRTGITKREKNLCPLGLAHLSCTHLMEWSLLAAARFYLAFLVICSHLKWFLPKEEGILMLGRPDAKAAVIGFLVISGYSIASSVMRNAENFYQRRIMRLYPVYLASLVFLFVPFWLTGSETIDTLNHSFQAPNPLLVLGNLLFLQNFLIPSISANPVIWTLSLEVCFYLFAPFIAKKVNDTQLLGFIGVSAIGFVSSDYFNLPHFAKLMGGLNVLLLGWSWCLGFYYYRNRQHRHAKILLVLIGVVALGLYGSPWRILTYLITVALLLAAPRIKMPAIVAEVCDFAGNISYPLYLVHVPCLIIAYSIFGWTNWVAMVALSLIVSVIFYYALDFYTRSRKKAIVQTSA
jgi:peptidoglycan/LPS O-acetylase OafA/YrhL